jgi:hypothetical protein
MTLADRARNWLIGLANWLAGVCLMWGKFWNETAESQVTGKSRAEVRERRLHEGDDAPLRPPKGSKPRLVEIGRKEKSAK